MKYEILSYTDITHKYVSSVKRLSDGEIFNVGDLVSMKYEAGYKDCPIRSMNEYWSESFKENLLYIDAGANKEGKGFGIHLGEGIEKSVK